MRWNSPKYGDTRVKTKFLLFPKKINRETRWLETATWIEEYYSWEWWAPVEWLDV